MKKEYIAPTKKEEKEYEEYLYNSLCFLATERPEFEPRKEDTLDELLDSFLNWADYYNDGYFSEKDDADTDRYSAWLVQEQVKRNDYAQFLREYDYKFLLEEVSECVPFDCVIYCDTLSLLNSGKADILGMVSEQLIQGDPCLDDIKDNLLGLAEERGVSESATETLFVDAPTEDLMLYVSYDKERIEFDYSESESLNDRRMAAFRIPCQFDAGRFLYDNRESLE